MWMMNVEEGGATYSVAFRGGEIPNAGVPLFDNPRHPTVVADTQRTLRILRELEPPDIFLHNHSQVSPEPVNSEIPVSSMCASCLDADGWTRMVANVGASFESMLAEAEAAR
jgi:hypothetical protein